MFYKMAVLNRRINMINKSVFWLKFRCENKRLDPVHRVFQHLQELVLAGAGLWVVIVEPARGHGQTH